MTGEDIIRYAAWRQAYLDLGGKEDTRDDPVHATGVKRLSSLFELPYWQVWNTNLGCHCSFRQHICVIYALQDVCHCIVMSGRQ